MDPHDSHALFREWDLYDRIVHDNWMAHREISAAINANLYCHGGPFEVLDLGSGDGEMAARILPVSDIERYVAVDLSASALKRLEQRPRFTQQARPCKRQIVCRDMAAFVRELESDDFDAVLANYSLHHFPSDQKRPLLDEIARVLRRGGCFVWTDVVRSEGEERDDYLRRLTSDIGTRWVSIPPADRRAAIEHVLGSDFPEQASWMHEQLASRGLDLMDEVFRDDFFGAWVYKK